MRASGSRSAPNRRQVEPVNIPRKRRYPMRPVPKVITFTIGPPITLDMAPSIAEAIKRRREEHTED